MAASNAATDLKAAFNATAGLQHSPTISDVPAFFARGPGCCQQPSSPTGVAACGPLPAAQRRSRVLEYSYISACGGEARNILGIDTLQPPKCNEIWSTLSQIKSLLTSVWCVNNLSVCLSVCPPTQVAVAGARLTPYSY